MAKQKYRLVTRSDFDGLPAPLDLPAGLTRRRLHEAIEDHVIEQARLVGTYSK